MQKTGIRKIAPVLAGALLIISGCGSDSEGSGAGTDTTETTVATETTATETTVASEHGAAPHWTYEGEDGPEHWGSLSDENKSCATGTEQSPIDLTGAVEVPDAELPDLTFDYHQSGLALMNNGHTVQAKYDPGSTLVVDGETYELQQFHFHAHSEHTVDGKAAPLELHLVHAREDAEGKTHLAVVGVLLVEGAENPAYASVLDHLPTTVTEKPAPVDGQTVDAAALLPADHTFFHYDGSLTTPPCTEGVSWQVMTTPVELSAEQIAAFTALYDDDFRPVQPLGDRELEVSGP